MLSCPKKRFAYAIVSNNKVREWVDTYGPDGRITARSSSTIGGRGPKVANALHRLCGWISIACDVTGNDYLKAPWMSHFAARKR